MFISYLKGVRKRKDSKYMIEEDNEGISSPIGIGNQM